MDNLKVIKIREAFNSIKKDIEYLKERITTLEKSQSQKSLTKSQPVSTSLTKSQPTAPTTAYSTAPTTAPNRLNISEKRLLKRLDSVKLMKAIQSCIDQTYSTSVMRDDIMNQFGIRERCFYNHLKKVRELLHITA